MSIGSNCINNMFFRHLTFALVTIFTNSGVSYKTPRQTKYITMRRLVVLSLLLILTVASYCSIHVENENQASHTLFYSSSSNKYYIVKGHHQSLQGINDDPVAWSDYSNTIQQTGWSTLQVKSNNEYDNEHQAFGAGYIEGYVTAELIGPYWSSFKQYNFDSNLTSLFDAFIVKQLHYLEQNVYVTKHSDPVERQYWNQVGLLIHQVKGMHAGYKEAVSANPDLKPMSFLDFWKFQYDGDTGDIESALSPADFSKMTYEQLTTHHLVRTKCSAFLKYTEDRSNILMTHSTWDTFSNMLRVYKHFELNFKNEGQLPVSQASNIVSFSSSPAWLTSADDFYITSKGLVITETTNDVFNNDLYKFVTPQAAPYWVRNAVANRMANTAPEWTRYFSIENGGTYNNQWMIIDTNKFVPGAAKSDPDLFHVLEQLPGMIRTQSQSSVLDKDGYWASYNIPFYPEVFNASGYAEMAKKYGDYWTYEHCPRANDFREYQSPVQSIEDLKKLIRRNDWQNDPYSLGDACNQIAARCDLNSPSIGTHYRAFGQIDSKVTDIQWAKSLKATAQNGPTHYAPNSPFTWNSKWSNVPHALQPTTFDFDWQEMEPKPFH
jgi:hypothetical protein